MNTAEKSRHAARAAGLSLLPGLGHLYIGERRGYRLLLVSVTAILVAWRFWPSAIWLYLVLAAGSAWDTYLMVTRDRGLW